MLALLQSGPGFNFSLGAVGTIIVIAVVLLIFLAPLLNWIPDLVYWFAKRRKKSDDPAESSPPPLARNDSSHRDEST